MFAARLIVTETGEALVKPEFALVELLFFKSEHEKPTPKRCKIGRAKAALPLIYTKKFLPNPSRR